MHMRWVDGLSHVRPNVRRLVRWRTFLSAVRDNTEETKKQRQATNALPCLVGPLMLGHDVSREGRNLERLLEDKAVF
jgi:hypothetical protein